MRRTAEGWSRWVVQHRGVDDEVVRYRAEQLNSLGKVVCRRLCRLPVEIRACCERDEGKRRNADGMDR